MGTGLATRRSKWFKKAHSEMMLALQYHMQSLPFRWPNASAQAGAM